MAGPGPVVIQTSVDGSRASVGRSHCVKPFSGGTAGH